MGSTGGKIITLRKSRHASSHRISSRCLNITTPVPVKLAEGESWPTGVEVEGILIYSVLKPENKQDFADIQEW